MVCVEKVNEFIIVMCASPCTRCTSVLCMILHMYIYTVEPTRNCLVIDSHRDTPTYEHTRELLFGTFVTEVSHYVLCGAEDLEI